MKKWMAMFAIVVFAAGPALAVMPMINQGTKSLGVSGTLDDTGNDFRLALSGSGGYFLMDYIEVGVGVGASLIGSDYKEFGASVFGEYNFDLGMPVVPIAGASAGFEWADWDGDSDGYVSLGLWGGAKYFLVDYAAIRGTFQLSLASKDVYNGGEDKMDWAFVLGTQWYF